MGRCHFAQADGGVPGKRPSDGGEDAAESYRRAAPYLGASWQLAGSVALWTVIGWFGDRKLHTAPWLLVFPSWRCVPLHFLLSNGIYRSGSSKAAFPPGWKALCATITAIKSAIETAIAGMDADIAQRMQAAVAVAGDDHRAGGGIDPEIAAVLVETCRVIHRHPRSGKDPLTLGGEDVGLVKEGRIGRDFARPAQLLTHSSNAGRKVHQEGPLVVCWLQRPK